MTPCKLSISFPQGGRGGRVANISIEDAISGATVVELEIDLTQWALALTSLQSRPAMMDFRPSVFGLICEHKTETVPRIGSVSNLEKAQKACAPFCVDGWTPYLNDRSTGDGFRVSFHRYVPPSPAALAKRYEEFNKALEIEGLPPIETPVEDE